MGLTWILLILAGCAIPPEQPTASPSAMPTEDQPTTSPTPETIMICPCESCVNVEAWIDQNENGKREPEEKPLRGVTFIADTRGRKRAVRVTSDVTGLAIITVTGCDCHYPFTVYAEVPPGYKLTTQPRLSNTECPQDEEWDWKDRRCPLGTCSFGFVAPPVTPQSLREADLHRADLRGVDLDDASLRWANLIGTDLGNNDDAISPRATLIGADLSNAGLSGADMSHAQLFEADLHGADLRGVNLNDANLNSTNLSAANLNGADLGNAKLYKAKYDRHTQWPEGFDPAAAGAVLEE
jgi:hypothetical protein